MKTIYLKFKLWYYRKKIFTDPGRLFYWLAKIEVLEKKIEKNKGNKIAAFIRQMKQR